MSQDHFQYRKNNENPWLSSVVVILCGLETIVVCFPVLTFSIENRTFGRDISDIQIKSYPFIRNEDNSLDLCLLGLYGA